MIYSFKRICQIPQRTQPGKYEKKLMAIKNQSSSRIAAEYPDQPAKASSGLEPVQAKSRTVLSDSSNLAEIFRLLGQQVRIQILLTIGREEACVCHIEAVTGTRQSTISQHLMVLRDAGLVVSYRDGRNIVYRLSNPELYDAIYQVASVAGIPQQELARLSKKPVQNCPCPRCNPGLDPDLSCKKIRIKTTKS